MKQFAFGGACYVGVAKSTFIWDNGTGGIDTYFRSTPLINQTWNPPKPKGKRSFLGPGDSQAKKRAKGTSPNIQWTPNQKIHAMELWLKRIAKRRIEPQQDESSRIKIGYVKNAKARTLFNNSILTTTKHRILVFTSSAVIRRNREHGLWTTRTLYGTAKPNHTQRHHQRGGGSFFCENGTEKCFKLQCSA